MFCRLILFVVVAQSSAVVNSAPTKNTVPFPNKAITWSILNEAMTVSPDEVRSAFLYAFDQWSAVIPRDFIHLPKTLSSTANIRISFETGDHGDGKPFPPGFNSNVYSHSDKNGTIHFNDDIVWYTYKEGRINSAQSNFVDITWFAVYETGKLLGLKDSSDKTSVMYPRYPNPKKDMHKNYILPKLSQTDIANIQKIYGKR